MRGAINYLADERVEVLPDFEEKLAALKNWLHKNHSHQDSDDDIKSLWHRVAYMIWIHEQRILESAEQQFIDAQKPNSESMSQAENPSNSHQWRLDSSSATTGKNKSPKNQVTQAQEKDCSLDNRCEEAAVADARIGKSDPLIPGKHKMLERPKSKVVELTAAATKPHPPAPTAESCPMTPIVPCRISASPLDQAPHMRDFRE